jgi:hypothetical protein
VNAWLGNIPASRTEQRRQVPTSGLSLLPYFDQSGVFSLFDSRLSSQSSSDLPHWQIAIACLIDTAEWRDFPLHAQGRNAAGIECPQRQSRCHVTGEEGQGL